MRRPVRFEHVEPVGSDQDQDDWEPDEAWRDEQVALIATDNPSNAAWPLIHLAYYYADMRWVEQFLVSVIRGEADWQIRELAVTCLGHCARTHREVTADVVLPALRWCPRQGPGLRGRAYDAITDVDSYSGRHWKSRDWWALRLEMRLYTLRTWMLRQRADLVHEPRRTRTS